jgi:pyridoxamine 5'-phosphate oxidase
VATLREPSARALCAGIGIGAPNANGIGAGAPIANDKHRGPGRRPSGDRAELAAWAQPTCQAVLVTSHVKSAIDLAALRRTYLLQGLSESDLAPDPFIQFQHWLADAVKFGLVEPNAMALATADAAGRPTVRHVLLKGFDARGFVFYTNVESRKAQHLAENPYAALAFPWFPMERQVLVTGSVQRVSREETLTYWRTRPRESQLGAWASPQSRVVESRDVLEHQLREVSERFPHDVPLPDFWGGYRVVPDAVEFWQGRVSRLHDRLRYRRVNEEWVRERLAP